MTEPYKAYIINYIITVRMEGLVYGHTADDALRRFEAQGSPGEATGHTGRAGRPTVRRCPDEDRDQ